MEKAVPVNKNSNAATMNAAVKYFSWKWSFYHDKSHQIWLWWAVDHKTNTPLAYTFGTREYKYLDELLELLSAFHIGTVYADNNFAYSSRISSDKLVSGKRNTQQIERDHLTLKDTHKTICFSKSPEFHKAAIGIFINIYFFGRTFDKSLLLWHYQKDRGNINISSVLY